MSSAITIIIIIIVMFTPIGFVLVGLKYSWSVASSGEYRPTDENCRPKLISARTGICDVLLP